MERNPSLTLKDLNEFVKGSFNLASKRNRKIFSLFLTSLITWGVAGLIDVAMAKSALKSLNRLNHYDVSKITKKKVSAIEVRDNYLPYLQVEGARLINDEISKAFAAVNTDLFIPIWQQYSDLFFTDVKIDDPTGKSFSGSAQLGYRHLSRDGHHLYGVYGSFDRKRTVLGNYFDQLTLGGECWLNRWFIGGNIYGPIETKSVDLIYSTTGDNLSLITNKTHEVVMPGVDFEVGYDVTKRLTGYIGGYYFYQKDLGTKCGPRAKIVYDWSLDHGRIFGIFDKIGFEVGVQRDKPHGTVWHLGTNIRLGWLYSDKPMLQGVSRHMVDLIHRNTDIVTMASSIREVVPKSFKVITAAPDLPNGGKASKLNFISKNSVSPAVNDAVASGAPFEAKKAIVDKAPANSKTAQEVAPTAKIEEKNNVTLVSNSTIPATVETPDKNRTVVVAPQGIQSKQSVPSKSETVATQVTTTEKPVIAKGEKTVEKTVNDDRSNEDNSKFIDRMLKKIGLSGS